MKRLKNGLYVLILLVAMGGAWTTGFLRRALPPISGEFVVAGIHDPVTIIRDIWGIPHIQAQKEEDAFFAMGYSTAQDRLFQMELIRHLFAGRLSELIGKEGLPIDKFFRTLNFKSLGMDTYQRSSNRIHKAWQAYMKGVNTYVASRKGKMPVEYTLMGISWEPMVPEDFVAYTSFLSWTLNPGWFFDPLYEKLLSKVGPKKIKELFPYVDGGKDAVHQTAGSTLTPDLLSLNKEQRALLNILGGMKASNNWAVSPFRSQSGGAILATDPHLGHGQPGIWYQAHLQAENLNVIGISLPGLPTIVMGHNKDIAWGFTALAIDGGDFFLERISKTNPGKVMYKGKWVDIKSRREVIKQKNGKPVLYTIRSTPHGPLVNDLIKGTTTALSYQNIYGKARHTNELDGIFGLMWAKNWKDFQNGAAKSGSMALNAAYADSQGHIALQTIAAIPNRKGNPTGMRYRKGWDGSEEWDGFHPFENNPFTLDPKSGFVNSSNNPITAPGKLPYISAYYEPVDRFMQIKERLMEKEKFNMDDMARIQNDTVLYSAKEETPMILKAFNKRALTGNLEIAINLLAKWDGDMKADSPAAAIFAVFYKHLFHEIFTDEFGKELVKDYREHQNVSAIMIRTVMNNPKLSHWFDRNYTQEKEDKNRILRDTLSKTIVELEEKLGKNPHEWQWGKLHTLTFVHAIGKGVKALAPYFNVGPFPVGGHANTPNKMEYFDADYAVYLGPSMRQITDFGDLNRAIGIIPTGQSGIAASPHYDDLEIGRAHV